MVAVPRPRDAPGMTIPRLARPLLLVGVPLAFSVVLWFHPMVGDYQGLREVTTRFQVVHVAMVLVLPLLAGGMYLLSLIHI